MIALRSASGWDRIRTTEASGSQVVEDGMWRQRTGSLRVLPAGAETAHPFAALVPSFQKLLSASLSTTPAPSSLVLAPHSDGEQEKK